MELERNAISEEELNEVHCEMASLFEQTILLTAHTYECASYECAFNVYPKFHKN